MNENAACHGPGMSGQAEPEAEPEAETEAETEPEAEAEAAPTEEGAE